MERITEKDFVMVVEKYFSNINMDIPLSLWECRTAPKIAYYDGLKNIVGVNPLESVKTLKEFLRMDNIHSIKNIRPVFNVEN